MKKTPIIIVAALGATAIAYTGASWWAGKQAEVTLEKQHKLIAELPYFVVKSRTYDRGVFSSHERTTIALNPSMIEPYVEMLKLAGKNVPNFELTYTQTIHHGPFPGLMHGDFSVLKADVTTDIEFSADTQKFLTKLFGDQKPLQIENRVRFNDDGVFSVKVPAFNYEETLAKVNANFQGLDSTLSYGGDFNRVDIHAVMPGFHLEAGPEGTFEFKDLRFDTQNTRGSAGLMLGDGKLTLASATFQHVDNDKPLNIKINGVSYLVKTTAEGDFINSSGDIGLNSLVLNDKTYGPVKLSVAATHLHAPTLRKLSLDVAKLQRETPPQEQASKMFDLFRKEGLPLLRNDPALAINELSVKLPEGEVSLHAKLALKGFEDSDLDSPIKLLNKLHAHGDIKLPKQVIETVLLWQTRGMIATDTENGEHPDTTDLDNLARNLMESQIHRLSESNLIKEDGDILSSSAEWEGGKLSVNGTPVPLPWQAPMPEAPTDGATAADAPPAAPEAEPAKPGKKH